MRPTVNPIPDAIKPIWRALAFVQTCNGLAFGLYLYTFGPWFYDAFGGDHNAATAMMLTSVLLGVRQAGVAVLEAPTGAIADAIGRVHAISWAWFFRVFFFSALAVLPLFHGITAVFLCAIFASISFAFASTFYNGALSAWVVDTCRVVDPHYQYGHLFVRGYSAMLWAELVGALIGITCFLEGVAYAAYIMGAFVCFVAMSYCLREMPESRHLNFLGLKATFSTITKRVGELLGIGAMVLRRAPAITVLILLYATTLFLENVVKYFWPIAVRAQLGVTNRQFTWLLLVSVMCLAAIVGARSLRFLLDRIHRTDPRRQLVVIRRSLLGLCFASATAVLALAVANRYGYDSFWWVMSIVVFISLTFGFLKPCYETLANHYIPPDFIQARATILSFGSMTRGALLLVLAVPSGGNSSATTTQGWAVPACAVLLSVFIARVVLKRNERRLFSEGTPTITST